jgi:phytoene dehydrogenase-like protein
MSTRPVIIGAGINGLVAAFYLARAGRRPLVLERLDRIGGMAGTHEIHPGLRVPSFAHATGPVRPDIEGDMRLAARGVEVICPAVTTFAPQRDGRPVVLARDPWISARNLAHVSEHDAAQFPGFERAVGRVAAAVAALMRETPVPLTAGVADLWTALRVLRPVHALGKEDGHRLARWLPMPVADFVEEWFENDALRAAIAARGLFGASLGPRSAGTTAILLMDAARQPHAPAAPCFVRGGPAALMSAMADAAREAGAEIRLSAEVERIDATEGGVRGVVLAGGEEIAADQVVSSADPVQTFLRFIDPALPGPELLSRVRSYRTDGVMMKLNVALDRLPPFRAASLLPDGLDITQALAGRIVMAPDIDYMERAFDACKYGAASERPWLECVVPSLTDASLAPQGRHVMSVYVYYTPYTLRGGNWETERSRVQARVLEVLESHAPGLTSSVLAVEAWAPPDIERELSVSGGHPCHGDMALDQLYFMRPFAGVTGCRTFMPGLFLCGAGTHPGGGLTGAGGALAAAAVGSDRGQTTV